MPTAPWTTGELAIGDAHLACMRVEERVDCAMDVLRETLDETMRALIDWYAETGGDGATATAATPA